MSQTAFGERLGVSRSVINNIELNALSKPEHKLSLYKLICSEFNVSTEWLLNGIGEMFVDDEAEYGTLIDKVMNGENKFAKNIFKTFARFEKDDWEALQRMIEAYLSVSDSTTSSAEDNPEKITETEAAHIKSRLNSAQKITLSALNLENDTKKASSL